MTDNKWTRRDFFRRSAGAAAAVVGGPVLVGACSRVDTGGDGNLLQTLRDEGTVTIGIANEAPFGMTQDGQVTGESPEVARAVFKNLGIDTMEAEIATEFDNLIPNLRQAQYDVVCAGMAILPERCQEADFSIPDYTTPTAFLVPKGNPENITSFEDVANSDVKLGVWTGTIEQSAAESAEIPDSRVVTFPDQVSMYEGIAAGRVYCGALTDISLRHVLEQQGGGDDFELTEGFRPVIDGEEIIQCGGFVFRQGNDSLRQAFNEELQKLQESGRWLEIARPFGFTEKNVPPEDVTTEQLCQA